METPNPNTQKEQKAQKTRNVSKLTSEELRTYKGFEYFSEEQAAQYIETVEQYCLITYNLYNQQLKARSL